MYKYFKYSRLYTLNIGVFVLETGNSGFWEILKSAIVYLNIGRCSEDANIVKQNLAEVQRHTSENPEAIINAGLKIPQT